MGTSTELSDRTSLGEQPAQEAKLPLAFFYYAGCSSLLGWNIILTFTHNFDCGVFDGQLWAGSGWPFWCTFAYSLSLNCVQGLLSSRTLAAKLRNPIRCHGGSVGIAAGVLGLICCDRFMGDQSKDSTLAVGLACVALIGASAAFFQSAVFGMAAAISPRLLSALMVGQGLAGVVSGAVGLSLGGSRLGLAASFAFAAVFVLAGPVILCLCVGRNPHIRPLMQATRDCDVVSPLPSPSQSAQHSSPLASPPTRGMHGVSPTLSNMSGTTSRGTPMLVRRRSSAEILVRSAWPQALTVCLVFMVTFTVFPGVVARWLPAENVTHLIATFQLMDVIGRVAPEVSFLKVRHGPTVSLLAFLRVFFIPAFILMERSGAWWSRSSWVQFSLMMLFAVSNGYVSTCSMMLGPGQNGLDEDERGHVGNMMSFFLVLGIFLGSLFALPTQIGMAIVPDCPVG